MFDAGHSLCSLAGREFELNALIASLTPEFSSGQQAAAEQLRGLIESIAATPEMDEPGEDAEWIAQRSGDSFSLFGPDLLITASFVAGEVGGIHISNENGIDWQFDFPPVMREAASLREHGTPQLRVRAYRDFHCVSDACFEADGSVTDPRDWRNSISQGTRQINETLDQLPTVEDLESGSLPDRPRPDFADPPRSIPPGGSTGLPGLGGGMTPGLGAAMAGVGRMAAGAAIGAAAGLAMAALQRGTQPKEPAEIKDQAGETTAPADQAPPPPAYPGSTVEGPIQPPWRIRVLAGPEAGSLFALKLQSSLGRGNDNEIQVLDPEISRNHLRFDVRDDGVVVTDLGSSRGTLVDGKKIDRPTPLRVNQIVGAGRSRFILESTAVGALAAQAPAAPEPKPDTEKPIWFFAERDAQQGPVTESVLRQRLATDLPRETLVWNSRLDGWKPAHALGLCPAPGPKLTAPAPATPGQAEWFFMEKGQRQGPVTESILRQRLATGLPRDAMVWKSSFDVWKPAHSAGLCGPALAAPAPQDPPIWYYMEKGVRQGPVAESMLRQRLATELPPDTQVWNPKLEGWKPAHALGLCAAPTAPKAPAAPEWYFMDHGVRQGPVPESLLRQRLAHGLPPDTQVWNPALDDWKPAHTLGLCASGAAPVVSPVPAPGAAPTPATGDTKKCPKCGRVLAAQHRFCAGCGTKVG